MLVACVSPVLVIEGHGAKYVYLIVFFYGRCSIQHKLLLETLSTLLTVLRTGDAPAYRTLILDLGHLVEGKRPNLLPSSPGRRMHSVSDNHIFTLTSIFANSQCARPGHEWVRKAGA